jgi:hypothetical protein
MKGDHPVHLAAAHHEAEQDREVTVMKRALAD